MAISSFSFYPCGDSGLTLHFGNMIDVSLNEHLFRLFNYCRNNPFPGLREAVPSYSSFTVYYDLCEVQQHSNVIAWQWVAGWLEKALYETAEGSDEHPGKTVRVPVCYAEGFAMDLENMTEEKGISREEVIALHTGRTYRVFMLGFLPGFPYLGEVDERLRIARKAQAVKTLAGSIGLAGRQTGIYSLTSPGGWQIIGRTPLTIFNPSAEQPCLFEMGDSVEFYSISADEFTDIKSRSAG